MALTIEEKVRIDAAWLRQREGMDLARNIEIASGGRLLTVAEVATRRGIREEGVRRSIKRGTLLALEVTPPGTPSNRKIYRIRAKDAEAWHVRALNDPRRNLVDYDPEEVAEANEEGLYTIMQTARKVGLSRTRIVALINKKRIAVVQKRIMYIHKDEIQRLIDQRAIDGVLSLA